MLSFLFSPLGKIVGIAGLLIFAALSLWGMVVIHDNGIRHEALLKFNQSQMEQVIKDQKDFIDKTQKLQETQKQVLDKITEQNAETNKKLEDVGSFLNSPEVVKQDKPASPILRETIRRLGGQ